jgi:hypothetical protein
LPLRMDWTKLLLLAPENRTRQKAGGTLRHILH